MARSTGLDAGGWAVKLVELDGSYRRTRLTRAHVERLAESPEDDTGEIHADLAAESSAVAFSETQIRKDGVALSHPAREAVLRTIDVPFSGRDAIRRVIKGEVEGSIHSHSIDDMIVEFHVVREHEEGARVLVAAVPKSSLRVSLLALERAGIEAERVDLDAMALFRCAEWCGAFGELPETAADEEETALPEEGAGGDDAEFVIEDEEAEELPVPVGDESPAGPSVRVVVDVGARGTRVLLVQDGVLREIRTIRSGDGAIVGEVASSYSLPGAVARSAALESLETGADVVAESELPVVGEGEGEAAEEHASVTVSHDITLKAVDRFLSRLRRELERFITAAPVEGRIDAVWVTGGGSRWPGVENLLAEVFGVAPRVLPVLDRLSHRLDDEQRAAWERELAVAVGLALPGVGGPAGWNLRQEDLAFTRGFDRVKFPLAIACMVALFALVVHAVKRHNDLRAMHWKYGGTYEDGRFLGYVGSLANNRQWFNDPGTVRSPFRRDEYEALVDELEATPVFDRLRVLRDALRRKVREEATGLGIHEDLELDSGLAVLVRFADILMELEKADTLGRYQVTRVDLDLAGQTRNRPGKLTVDLVLRGSDMRAKGEALIRAIRNDIAEDDSPFVGLKGAGREEPFPGGGGMEFTVQLDVAPDYPPIPSEGAAGSAGGNQ